MSISYAPLDDEEVFLPKPKVTKPLEPKVKVKQPDWPKFREGTECNFLVMFFIVSLIYILMSD